MKRTILTIISLCSFTILWGMNEFAFKHLGVSDGLSNSQINCITASFVKHYSLFFDWQ